MNKIMKKLSFLGLLAFGVMAVAKAPAMAHDYVSSTWTAQFIAYVSTQTDTSLRQPTAGGVTSGGGFDVTRIFVSTGYNNGANFVCIDTLPLTAQTGGAPSYIANFGSYDPSQYLFPPMVIVPSSGTISTFLQGTGNLGAVLDLRDYGGGGTTVKNGLVCYIQGDTTNRYLWKVETQETPSAVNRRER